MDEYNDWQIHFEDCPDCKQDRPCAEGQKIKDRVEREAKEENRA